MIKAATVIGKTEKQIRTEFSCNHLGPSGASFYLRYLTLHLQMLSGRCKIKWRSVTPKRNSYV